MTRKDTILVAVIVNAGLLAVLFATAVIYDSESSAEGVATQPSIATATPTQSEKQDTTLAVASPAGPTNDEVDNVLNYYANPSQPIVVETNAESFVIEQPKVTEEATDADADKDYVEVTVKKGDSLDKISKANGTTVSAIKKANQLKNEKLKIGTVLKVPLKKDEEEKAEPPVTSPKKAAAETAKEASSEELYHTIKSGDSPWKIAKQYNVKYEDILKLNKMDEEKAKNLKIGTKIRVK